MRWSYQSVGIINFMIIICTFTLAQLTKMTDIPVASVEEEEEKVKNSTEDVDMVNLETTTTEKEEENEHADGSKDDSGETTDTCSEKNESKEMDDEDLVFCAECKTSECFMWRRMNSNGDNLICSLCHLKRIKNESTATQQSTNPSSSKSSVQSASTNSTKNSKDTVRISKRKNKTNKKFTNGFYGERIIKNGHSKSRRNLYKRKPTKSADGVPSIVASQCIYHNVS